MTDDLDMEVEEEASGQASAWKGPYGLRAFQHRNFTLLWVGQMISLTGTWMQGLSLPFLVYDMTGSKSLLGIVAAAGLLPSVIVTLPSGVIADRFSKRKIVMITQSLLMLQALTLAVLKFTDLIQPWHIVALGAFAGFATSIDMPTRQAMVVELVGKEDLPSAVALNSMMFNLTRIGGPFVGGIVYAVVGPAWCFLINAISYLGAIVGVFLMKNVKSLRQASRDESMWKQICEGCRHVWGKSLIRNMLLMTAISQLVIMPYAIFLPVYAIRIFKVGPTGQGFMSMCVGIGALTGAALLSTVAHRLEQKTIVFFGAILAPLGLLAFAFCTSFHAALVCLVAVGLGMMTFMASSNTIMQMGSPADLGGRVMSLRALTMFTVAAGGSYLMAKLSEIKHVHLYAMTLDFDVKGTILVGASAGLLSALYFAVSSLRAAEASVPALVSEDAIEA